MLGVEGGMKLVVNKESNNNMEYPVEINEN